MLEKIGLNLIANNFVWEMQKAKNGEVSSLSYNKLDLQKISNKYESFDHIQVLMIGGSHIENVVAKKSDHEISLGELIKKKLPPIQSKQKFLEIIDQEFNSKVDLLAINLAFALQINYANKTLDGELLQGSKEHSFVGLIGEHIGKITEEFLGKKYQKEIKVIVLNDLFCLGLGARKLAGKNFDGLAFGVLGTGMNLGFWENTDTLVNLESGNFNIFNQSLAGKELDQNSQNPGKQLFEKEISGKYLPNHYQFLAKNKGLEKTQNLPKNSQEISTLAGLETNFGLAKQTLLHSQALFAAQIFGLHNFMKNRGFLEQKLTIVMEGSLFWQGYKYLKNVEKYLQILGLNSDHFEFIFVENAGLLGLARLIL